MDKEINAILNDIKTDTRLTRTTINKLEKYTDELVRTIILLKWPHINYIRFKLKELYNLASDYLGEDYFYNFYAVLYRSMIYRLLDRVGFTNLSKQQEEDEIALKKIKDSIKERFKNATPEVRYEIFIDSVRNHYEKFLTVTYGKIYEIEVFNIAMEYGLNPVWNNSNGITNKYSPFDAPIMNLTNPDSWQDYDIYLDNYDVGLDVKAGTFYRIYSRNPNQIYISNAGFSIEKFKQYQQYNGKTKNKRPYLAISVPELLSDFIIYEDAQKLVYEKNIHYKPSFHKEDTIYILDINKFLELNELERNIVPYMDTKQFCIPIKKDGGLPSFLYTFYDFEEKLKTNSLQV